MPRLLYGRITYLYLSFFHFLDALLADLQNTVPGHNQHGGGGGSSVPGYGSLNGVRNKQQQQQQQQHASPNQVSEVFYRANVRFNKRVVSRVEWSAVLKAQQLMPEMLLVTCKYRLSAAGTFSRRQRQRRSHVHCSARYECNCSGIWLQALAVRETLVTVSRGDRNRERCAQMQADA